MTENNTINPPNKPQSGLFYGYIVVSIAFLIMALSFGMYGTFGVFLTPLVEEFGWSRAITSGAFSFSQIVYGLLGIVMGGLTDKFGPRLILTLCAIFLGAGCILISRVDSLWQLYLFMGMIIGIGMSGVWVPQLSTIAKWFTEKRGLMTGIVIAGSSIGQLAFPPLVSRMITSYGWRWSYLIMGATVTVVMITAIQWLRSRPSQQTPSLPSSNTTRTEVENGTKGYSLKESLKTIKFWMLFIIILSYGYGIGAMVVHVVPNAIDKGISSINAAYILAASSGISILGNYIMGSLADRFGNRQVIIAGCVLISLALFWLPLTRETWMIFIFPLFFGLGMGAMCAESPMVAELFGLNSHGLIYGVLHISFTLGAALGPVVTGYFFDISGNYNTAFQLGAIFNVLGIILALLLKPNKKRNKGKLHVPTN